MDDADLSSETLLATLNCLSRYLVHPRLIPVFTLTGALAEELLCKEFERRLQIAPVKGGASKIRPVFLSVTENLALQSLSKFFPPRNRIKLGNTVQRIRDGEYIPADEETNSGHSDSNGKKPGKAVQDLLSAANLILFGQSKHLLGPDTRRILYTTHLRRQIQIIDVLHEAGVMKFFEEEEDERPDWRRLDCKRPAWFRVFREATWSLLNVHRDILREFDLNFESLYGWANKENLRVLLLDSLGKVDYAQLRPLLRAWFYSHEDRRPELFSLLAACVFSPRRFGGETPEGREFHQIEKEALQAYEEKYSIAPGMATLWTLELWLGFYLPLMIRHQRSYVPKQSAEMHFSRLGWNLVMGAGNAVKEAMTDQVSFFPGMLPLSPSCLPPAKESMDHKSMLLLRLWCFNGFNAGFPWLTASLWRGLSLVGRLIELDFHLTTLERKAKQRNDRKKDDEKIPNETLDEAITIRRKALIETILIEHLNIGSQTYAPPYFEVSQVNKAIDPEHHEAYFSDWSKLSLPNSDEDKDEQFELLDGLAQDLMKWLKTYNNPQKRIYLCGDNEKTGPTIPVLPEDEVDELLSKTSRSEEEVRRKILEFRNNCFIQRIHGNSLLGKLWSDLEDAFLEMGPDSMNIAAALGKWLSVFCDYWSRPDGKDEHESGLSTVRDLVEQCPFVFPLIEYDRNTAKPPEPGEDGENPKSPDSPKDIKQSRELNKPNFFSDGNVLETLRKVTGLPPYPYIKEEKKIEQTLTWREKEQEIGGTEQENGETPGEGEGGNK
ncbi:MAG: hypothetical protein QNK37_26960 [Acidobacteriota bacterium]|nr:hypothetical protein [Acidobacteriota bacterium]